MNRDKRRMYYIPNDKGHFGRPKEALRKNKNSSKTKKKVAKTEFHKIIEFCVQNCNSVHSERKEKLTKLGIKDSKADVIILTETKTGENSNVFNMPGYKIVAQRDRKRARVES